MKQKAEQDEINIVHNQKKINEDTLIKKKQENRKIKKLSLFELQNTEKGMLFRIGKKF